MHSWPSAGIQSWTANPSCDCSSPPKSNLFGDNVLLKQAQPGQHALVYFHLLSDASSINYHYSAARRRRRHGSAFPSAVLHYGACADLALWGYIPNHVERHAKGTNYWIKGYQVYNKPYMSSCHGWILILPWGLLITLGNVSEALQMQSCT